MANIEVSFCKVVDDKLEEHGFLQSLRYALDVEFDLVQFRIVVDEEDEVRVMVDVTYDHVPAYASTMLSIYDYDENKIEDHIDFTIESLKKNINEACEESLNESTEDLKHTR